MKHNILSIDGGGIRGLVALKSIERLEQILIEQNLTISTAFTGFAGTSTGSIIAALLACGYTAKDALNFYQEYGDDIFDKTWYRLGLFRPKYSDKFLNTKLLETFGNNKKLSNLSKYLLIPSFNKTTKHVEFFSNINMEKDFKIFDVVRSSAAAPTFLNSHKINNSEYVDGGLSVNNPAEQIYWSIKNLDITGEINILSIGTGSSSEKLRKFVDGGGMFQWTKPTIDILLSQQALSVHRTLNNLYEYLDSKYLRIVPILVHANDKIDDASKSNMKNLILDGETTANLYDEQLRNFVKSII